MGMLKWYGHVARKGDNEVKCEKDVEKGYKAEEFNTQWRNKLATTATENQQPVDHWLLVVSRQRYIYRQTDTQTDK